MTTLRSLPLRLGPEPGEGFDSWLESCAWRAGVAPRAMLDALGLPLGNYTIYLSPAEAGQVAAASGVSPARLDEMTLRIYDGVLVTLHPSRRALRVPQWWTRGAGSRYCPQCLAQRDGRWLLRWHLNWVFACTEHQILLRDACPRCGHVPHTPAPRNTPPTAPGHCAACDHDLSADTAAATATAAVLAAQQRIDDALRGAEHPAGYAQERSSALFTDLTKLCAWLTRRAEPGELGRFAPGAPDALHAHLQATADNPRPLLIPPRHSSLIAALAAWSTELTCDPDAQSAITRVRALLRRSPGRGLLPPDDLPQWRQLSAPVHNRFLRALDPDLDHLDRIRHLSPINAARIPAPAGTAGRARHLPQQLWPRWTIRLMPTEGFALDPFRGALTDLIMLAGHPGPTAPDAAAHLHPNAPRTRIGNTLRDLAHAGHQDVFTAICLLAQYLDRDGAPIDYQRRREAITAPVIDAEAWRHLAFTAGAHPGQHTRLLQAQRYLHELLTGADLTDPACALALRDPLERSRQWQFTQSLTTPLRTALARYAAEYLTNLGIDEPLTWQPPLELVTGLDLPGHDLDDLDLAEIHRLVIDRHQSPATAAAALNTGIDQIRLALEQIPQHARAWGAKAPPTAFATQARARELLTREFLELEYIHNAKSIQQIAEDNGLHRRTVTQFLREHEITVMTAELRAHQIDPTWLRAQYLQATRSFESIAQELGVSRMTVARAATTQGITPRPPGVASHPQMLRTLPADLPADIKAAVEHGLGGWQRLHRFEAAMAYPSLNQACAALEIKISRLVKQIQRLECDIGAPLYQRATSLLYSGVTA